MRTQGGNRLDSREKTVGGFQERRANHESSCPEVCLAGCPGVQPELCCQSVSPVPPGSGLGACALGLCLVGSPELGTANMVPRRQGPRPEIAVDQGPPAQT